MPRSERKKFKAKAMRRIKNFENSVRAHEMRGAGPPDNIENIEEWHKVAKSRLVKLIMELYEKAEPIPDM